MPFCRSYCMVSIRSKFVVTGGKKFTEGNHFRLHMHVSRQDKGVVEKQKNEVSNLNLEL